MTSSVQRRGQGRKPVPDDLLVDLFEQGMSVQEIAQQPGVDLSKSAIRARLEQAGAIERARRARAELVARVVEMYRSGMSARQIGEGDEVPLTRGQVSRILRDEGVEVRPNVQRPDVDTAELVRLYVEERLSIRSVADRVGMTYKCVHRRLVKAQVQLRDPGRQAGKHYEVYDRIIRDQRRRRRRARGRVRGSRAR